MTGPRDRRPMKSRFQLKTRRREDDRVIIPAETVVETSVDDVRRQVQEDYERLRALEVEVEVLGRLP